MSTQSEFRPLQVLPGVEPVSDNTSYVTQHYTASQGIRFVKGLPQKRGGNQQIIYTGATLSGAVRTTFGTTLGVVPYAIEGTNTKLFSLLNNTLSDITPVGLTAGPVNESSAQGYGAGRYGVGRYGVPLVSSTARIYPRIWAHDRFGATIISTPGAQGAIYPWAGDPSVAPVALATTGAPTAVNYLFVSDNILVTLGADGVPYRIKASDLGNYTIFVSSSTNQVFVQDVQGVGQWVSHAPLFGKNLLFSNLKTYTFRYIGLPSVWELKELDSNVGIIAQNARVSVEGLAYWMGNNNFYVSDGSSVQIIPSNSSDRSTILRYVFDNMNTAQKSKCFAWYNKPFNEIWFHYPRGSSMEPNAVARLCLYDNSWCPDMVDMTSAEYPVAVQNYAKATTAAPIMVYEEFGNDDNGAILPWFVSTKTLDGGKKVANLQGFIPDSTQTGNISVNITGGLWPQASASTINNTYTVTPTNARVQMQGSARYWRYTVSGAALGQVWRAGNWMEDLQPAGNE